MVDLELNRNQLTLLKNGDMQAFDTIYNRYCKRLYYFVIRYVKSDEDAEEIVQEVFIKVWENRERINVFSSFESFLFTIAYNSTISLIRKRVSEKKYLDHLASIQETQNAPEVVNEVQFHELNERVNQLIAELTPRQQEIFRLSREEGLSHDEIAVRLSLSSNTVKNHLVSALKYLRSNLDNGLMICVLFLHLFF
ncbi:RNA polymerase sigma-70 factor (ECF subfamily) [Mangrovibacterium diazotrophicum]|uniref:RNA polymerase sigma factor n=1 Tax=Mangrovibacterium diazotrophicum TaxID=1261403 RepID=A0A419VY60_9BACT|nr:RNA polymerase sigma-70 factor (ECF subfamily) [Mangrovibacterium diazotrophicum]